MTDPDSLAAEPLSFEQRIAVDQGGDADQGSGSPPDGSPTADTLGIDAPDLPSDPMGMYLRDLSAVPLLTREGEVALAKRIEAGRRKVLEGLCSSLPAMAAVRAWRDEIRGGSLALRHVVDVAATYGAGHGADGAGDAHGAGENDQAGASRIAAMEDAVRPAVMETLDVIAASHTKLRRLQERRIELARRNRTLTASQERRRRALEREIAAAMGSLCLTDGRIEALVDEVRAAGGRLRRCEGALLRLAAGCGVPREAFLAQHEGRELESAWLSRVGRCCFARYLTPNLPDYLT